MKHAANKLILAIKPDTFLTTQEINLMTLYSNNCKKIRLNILLKKSKKANAQNVVLTPIFPPQFFLFPPPQFYHYSLLGARKY